MFLIVDMVKRQNDNDKNGQMMKQLTIEINSKCVSKAESASSMVAFYDIQTNISSPNAVIGYTMVIWKSDVSLKSMLSLTGQIFNLPNLVCKKRFFFFIFSLLFWCLDG